MRTVPFLVLPTFFLQRPGFSSLALNVATSTSLAGAPNDRVLSDNWRSWLEQKRTSFIGFWSQAR